MKMNVSPMLLTERDMVTISGLIDAERRWPVAERTGVRAFGRRLAAAGVLRDDEMPRDVVTLLSRVRVRDLATGQDSNHTLVTPAHASPAGGAISVLSPMGAAVLGCREGDVAEYSVPGGLRRLRIEQVLYQPEAAARRAA
jgi:regulator of nucleoside diphosphate kinase